MNEELNNEEMNSDITKMKNDFKIIELQNNDGIDFLILSSLSIEEINKKILEVKNCYEKNIQQIDMALRELNITDEKINQINSNISKSLDGDVGTGLEKEDTQMIIQKNSNIVITSNDDSITDIMISQIKSEINSFKRKHNKKISDIQKELNNNLQENLSLIREEYNMRIRQYNDTHDKSIKILQEEIFQLQREIEDGKKNNIEVENQGLSIARNKHEEILSEIKIKNKNEIMSIEKEIYKYENLIKQQSLMIQNQNFQTEESQFLNFAEFHKDLQKGSENQELICVISQLDTPSCSVNNDINLNSNLKSYISNKSLNSFKKQSYNNYVSSIEKENICNITNTKILDKEKYIHNQFLDSYIEEGVSIQEESPINSVKNLLIGKTQYFD